MDVTPVTVVEPGLDWSEVRSRLGVSPATMGEYRMWLDLSKENPRCRKQCPVSELMRIQLCYSYLRLSLGHNSKAEFAEIEATPTLFLAFLDKGALSDSLQPLFPEISVQQGLIYQYGKEIIVEENTAWQAMTKVVQKAKDLVL